MRRPKTMLTAVLAVVLLCIASWGAAAGERVPHEVEVGASEETQPRMEHGENRKGGGEAAHAQAGKSRMSEGPGAMMMGGRRVPYRLMVPTMAALAIVVLGFAARRSRGDSSRRVGKSFLRGWFKVLLLKRGARFAFQAAFVFLFLMVIVAGLAGIQVSGSNIATVLTWNIWWIGIIFAILLAGKVWCFVCPWQAIADWLKYLAFWRRKEPVLCLNKKWPRGWRNIYLAAGMFIGLTWLELGYGITGYPVATALFALLMLAVTVVPNLIFEKGAFCRYGCLVGRISGLYAMFTPMELRAGDKGVCANECRGKDCLRGNEKGYPCPTSMYLGSMELNTYCILCAECIKTCPHDNVSINLRPFAADLVKSVRTRIDESYLAIMMLSLTYFHALTMTPLWEKTTENVQRATSLSYLGAFSVEMAVISAAPVAVYFLVTELSRRMAGDRGVSSREAFVNYAYSLLPMALFFHLAHNAAHLFREGGQIISVISDPLGVGWDLFGTAGRSAPRFLSPSATFDIQVVLLYMGLAFSVYVAHSVGMRTFRTRKQAWNGIMPVVAFLTGAAVLGVWMLSQPMVPRTGM